MHFLSADPIFQCLDPVTTEVFPWIVLMVRGSVQGGDRTEFFKDFVFDFPQ